VIGCGSFVCSGCCWAVVLVVGGGVGLVVVLGTGNVPEIKNNTENVGNK
jgi:predicted metal-binding membrane protein